MQNLTKHQRDKFTSFGGDNNTPLLVNERANIQKLSTDRKLSFPTNKVGIMNTAFSTAPND